MEHDLSPAKLLLVEDDEVFAEELSAYLMGYGFEVHFSQSVDVAFESLPTFQPDVVILDQFLHGADSLSRIQDMRKMFTGGLMVLTGNTDPTDRVVGLEMGADDYVSKLTAPREILARLRSLLRRREKLTQGTESSTPPFVVGQWRLDTARRELFGLDGELVHLTSAEFGTLRYLDEHRGQPVSREDLSLAVLRRRFDALDRSIDNLVARLRKKFEALDPEFRSLKTVRGEGYIFLGFDKALTPTSEAELRPDHPDAPGKAEA